MFSENNNSNYIFFLSSKDNTNDIYLLINIGDNYRTK